MRQEFKGRGEWVGEVKRVQKGTKASVHWFHIVTATKVGPNSTC